MSRDFEIRFDDLGAPSGAMHFDALPNERKNMTTTSTLTRPEMIAAIRLRDPSFADSTTHSIDYVAGRYSGTVAMQPVVGVARPSAPVESADKLDEADLSPVTRAMIAAENERDRARVAKTTPTKTSRTDAADDDDDLSPVTRAMIAAHNRAESRRGGFNGGGNDAA